jgi:nucleoside-diphosphate-sugar epimerase
MITGAMGQIGSELSAELSRKYGRDNVVCTDVKTPDHRMLSFGSFQHLDVTDKEAITKVAKDYDVDTIYHLSGVLSAKGEDNPALAWKVNTGGLHNILDVARERKMVRVFWPSSIAVFGPQAPRFNTPQETALVPTTIYGVTKVAGELLCNYYWARFGLDVRSIRYPGIISSETLPGGGTTDYAVEIFYEALEKKNYTCFVKRDTTLPMLYMPDCINATLDLMDAHPTRITIHTAYNLGGLTFSVEDLANEIKKYVPELVVEYKPDSRQKIADSWPISIDDSAARRDWNWKPAYDLETMTKNMVKSLAKKLGA